MRKYKMEMHVSKVINAPVEQVFDVFSDIEQIEHRVPGIIKSEILSEVTSGIGTRWRETREMFGREAVEEMEISAFAPNQSYEVIAESGGAAYHTIYTFTSEGDGTNVALVFSATPKNLFSKLMSPLGYLFKGVVRKAFEADMESLKKVCETQPE
jgi:hypothetical protein